MTRILFDQSVPFPLIRHLNGHQIETAYRRGWATLTNGDLLDAIERAGFDVFLAADQHLRYQQNVAVRHIAIIVIGTNFRPVIAANPHPIVAAVKDAQPGTVSVVPYPKATRPGP